MFKFLAKNKKIEKILNVEERVNIEEEKKIQEFDLDLFAEKLNQLKNEEDAKKELKKYEEYFKEKEKKYSVLNLNDLSDKLTEILIDNETLFRINKVINNSIISEQVKNVFNIFNKYTKQNLDFIEKIKNHRKLDEQINEFKKENTVSLVVSDIFYKIFVHLSENDDTPIKNFETILSNIILNLQEKINNVNNKNILKKTFQKKDSNKYTVIYPFHPLKYLDTDIELFSDFVYSNINTIEKCYSLFNNLNKKIFSLTNVSKRTGAKLLSRKNPGTKMTTEKWLKIKEKLYKIVSNNIEKLNLVLLKNIQEMILEKKEKVVDFFENPLLELEKDSYLYIYDIPSIIMSRLREKKIHDKNEYIFLVENLIQGIDQVLINKMNENNKEAQFLMFVRYYNLVEDLSKKYNYKFIKEKIILVKYLSKLRGENLILSNSLMSNEELKKIENEIKNYTIEQIKENDNQIKNYNLNLNEIFNQITSLSNFRKDPRSNTEQIDELFNKFVPKNNYQILLKFILEYYRNKNNDNIDVEFYKRNLRFNFMPIFIGFTSKFFTLYNSIYPKFEKDFFETRAIDFDNWLDSCQDNGKYFKAHVMYIYSMINHGLMGFNQNNETIEFFTELIPKYQEFINKEQKKVNDALYLLLQTPEKIKMDQTSNNVCYHEHIIDKINKLNESLELDKDNQNLIKEIENQQKELGLCSIETSGSIVCKQCGIVLEQNYSYAPETFEEGEELLISNQMIDFATLKEMEREKQEEENIFLITSYLNIILDLYKIKKVEKISLMEINKNIISETEYDKIISDILNIVKDEWIFNGYLKLFKTSFFIHKKQRLSQLIHDVIKFLVIMQMYDKLKIENKYSEIKQIQKLFSEIQNIKNIIPISVYDEKHKLNLVRNIYNISVEINNNTFFRTFLQDNEEINSFEDSSTIEKLIITQNFKIKEKNVKKITNILKNVVTVSEETVNSKLVEQINKKFQENFITKIVENSYQFKNPINIVEHLSRFIKLKQSQQNSGKIKTYFLLNQIKKLPIDITHNKWNFITLFLYLKYNTRTENLNNPEMSNYFKQFKHIDLLKAFQKIKQDLTFNDLLNYLVNLYKFRFEFLEQIKEYFQLIEFIYKKNKSKASLNQEIVKKFKNFIGYKNIESDIVSNFLNSSNFNNFFIVNIEKYYENYGRDFLIQINNEINNYKKTIEYLLGHYNNIQFMCPFDGQKFSKSLSLNLHITSKHKMINNSDYKVIVPFKPFKTMSSVLYEYENNKLVCGYCVYQGTYKEIENHLVNIHLLSEKTIQVYNKILNDQYNIYIKKIGQKYTLQDDLLFEREIPIDFQIDQLTLEKIDNSINNIKYFQHFCFKNTTKFNLHEHKFVNNKCIFCKMNPNHLFRYGSKNKKILNNLIHSVINRFKKLLNIYNLDAPDIFIFEMVQNKKLSPTGDNELYTDKFLYTENNWEKLRKLEYPSITIILNILSIIKKYIIFFYKPENQNDILENVSLDFINLQSNLYFENKQKVVNNEINNYLKSLSLSYNKNVSEKLILDPTNEKEIEKLNKTSEHTEITKTIKNVNQNILKNTKKEISKLTKYSVSNLISNLDVYTIFNKNEIMEKINKIEKYNDNHLKDRKFLLKPIPRIIFKTLLDIVDNKKDLYKSKGFIFDIPEEEVSMAVKE